MLSDLYGAVSSSAAGLSVLRSTPQFESSASKPKFGTGGLNLLLNGLSGPGAVIVYASTNLHDWQPVFTIPPTVGTIHFLDSSATNMPVRFDRAVEQ